MKTSQNFERITISVPIEILGDIEKLQKEFNVSKSELFKISFEKFLSDYKKQTLKKIAEMMKKEYNSNKELTIFTSIDSDDFI
ncbi:MAG: hypothetical protein H7263_11100 [Candidatus Sericytochromatia bacterium]|nr:hypothetical protein [Candidatus Sericytochromatia bacterium]